MSRYLPSEKEAEKYVGKTPDNGDGPVSPLGTMRVTHLLNIIVTGAAGTILAAGGRVVIDKITGSGCEVVGGILVTGLARRWVEGDKVFFDAFELEISQSSSHESTVKVSEGGQPL